MVTNTDWFFDIFSWQNLAAAVTVFALLTSTAFIPVWHLFRKRREEQKKQEDEKETEKIKKISGEILNPVVNKLSEHDEVLRDMKLSSKQNDKDTKDTLATVRALVSEFHNYKENQHKVNARLYFLEGAYNSSPGNTQGYKDWRTINRERQFLGEGLEGSSNSNNNNDNNGGNNIN